MSGSPEPPRLPLELVEFSRRAIEGADVGELLVQAASEVAQCLDVGFVKVLEHLEDERCLLVRAGVGWGEGVVGQARIGADMESPAGFALHTGAPVIANDLEREERFRCPELLREHGVRSAVNVIIASPRWTFGVLEADSRRLRVFSEEDVRFLQGYANILALALEQARLVKLNAELAARQETLFRELQHRIKNNNQQLVSLISMQLSTVDDRLARESLQKVADRIRALNHVSGQLQEDGRPDRVDLARYLAAIIGNLVEFRAGTMPEVKLDARLAPLEVATDRAQAIGLILNEFLTNSFKYAFADRGGTFTALLESDGGSAALTLADDGPGVADDAPHGLGLRLIEGLTRQIEGTITWPQGNGARLVLRFPLRTAREKTTPPR
jgi:two-component sensor histidine kinase